MLVNDQNEVLSDALTISIDLPYCMRKYGCVKTMCIHNIGISYLFSAVIKYFSVLVLQTRRYAGRVRVTASLRQTPADHIHGATLTVSWLRRRMIAARNGTS